MVRGRLRDLLHPLGAPDRRVAASAALAQALGADRVLLYVKDPALDVMLPAPGMPKTLAGGPLWRAFLRGCLTQARPVGAVDFPAGEVARAQAVAMDGAALILLGEPQPDAVLDEVEAEFPLLAQLLNAQQALQTERAEAAEAREAAARAGTLAAALDTARAASAELNLQLRHEHQRKDEFLAMLAHELRNPLSPLVNSIEILRRGSRREDRFLVEKLDVMSRQLQQLRRLVDDLLDVSRVSRGLIELRRERMLLGDVLADAVEAVRPLLDARSHVLQRTPVPPTYVNCDRVRLTQVFSNLLANAAKYTDPGGRLSLSVVSDQHRVSVVIQDTGIGIPQEMLTRIFDMFMQVPESLTRSQGGLGIGLTLVRRLVELHGGRVSAYSRGPGEGSTFTVSLPQVQAPARLPAALAPAPAPAPPPAAASPVDRLRVLVVDDNRDAADTLAEVLGFMGAQVHVGRNGADALELAAAIDPHLVLLDIGLPGMDGYEVARRLRQLPGLRAQLVALTGYGSPQDRQRALDAGFHDHRVKPLAPEAAQELLHQLAMHQPS